MNKKKLLMVSHIDFDGAVPVLMAENYLKDKNLNSDDNIEFIPYFADNFNIIEVLTKCLDTIEKNSVDNTCLLITDICNLGGEHIFKRIDALYKNGLKVLHIDHHASEENNKFSKQYVWMHYTTDNICSSMQFFVLINKILFGNIQTEQLKDILLTQFDIKNDDLREYIAVEFLKLDNNTNLNIHIKNLSDILNINKSIEYSNNLKKYFIQYINLVWAANLIDFRKTNELEGLNEILTYWDMAAEYSDKLRNEILKEIMQHINLLPKSIEMVNSENSELRSKTKYNERMLLSRKSINVYKAFDKSNNEYYIAAAFAEPDMYFPVESFKGKLNEILDSEKYDYKKIDSFITLSRSSLAEQAFVAVRPMNLTIWDILDKLIKDNKPVLAVNAGFKMMYNNDIYNKIIELRKQNLATESKEAINKNNTIIKELIKSQLEENFKRIEHCEYNKNSREYSLYNNT